MRIAGLNLCYLLFPVNNQEGKTFCIPCMSRPTMVILDLTQGLVPQSRLISFWDHPDHRTDVSLQAQSFGCEAAKVVNQLPPPHTPESQLLKVDWYTHLLFGTCFPSVRYQVGAEGQPLKSWTLRFQTCRIEESSTKHKN